MMRLPMPTNEESVAWAEEATAIADVLRELDDKFDGIDNGRCTTCRVGHRLWKIPGKVKGPCDYQPCLSHRVGEILERYERPSAKILERIKQNCLDRIAATPSTEAQKCVRCGHNEMDADGMCRHLRKSYVEPHDKFCCGCKCVFPTTGPTPDAVAEAWREAKALVRDWLATEGVALTGVNGEVSRSTVNRFKLGLQHRIVKAITTHLGPREDAITKRDDLICHMHVHSGYENCGYRQMTTGQKRLYDDIWAARVAKDDAEESAASSTEEE